jgi:hypothetical protein
VLRADTLVPKVWPTAAHQVRIAISHLWQTDSTELLKSAGPHARTVCWCGVWTQIERGRGEALLKTNLITQHRICATVRMQQSQLHIKESPHGCTDMMLLMSKRSQSMQAKDHHHLAANVLSLIAPTMVHGTDVIRRRGGWMACTSAWGKVADRCRATAYTVQYSPK